MCIVLQNQNVCERKVFFWLLRDEVGCALRISSQNTAEINLNETESIVHSKKKNDEKFNVDYAKSNDICN